jgi:arylsulfatase A-like enzyme
LKAESEGKTGLGVYADGMVEHDGNVGQLLDKLKELGIEDNTIIMYSTDNGAETFSWPDGGTTMFRGEKNTQWEGGFRVPTLVKWPGVIKPGTVINDIGAHEDMFTTLAAAGGDKTAKKALLKGRTIGDRSYKVHIDGYDLGPALKGEGEWPRKEFIYWSPLLSCQIMRRFQTVSSAAGCGAVFAVRRLPIAPMTQLGRGGRATVARPPNDLRSPRNFNLHV